MCYMSCTVPAQPMRIYEPVGGTEGERFFHYVRHVRALPREALRREHAQQQAAFAHDQSDASRLRLALLLSLPDTDFGNNTSALQLLQDYLKEQEPQHPELREIAALLFTCINNNQQMHAYESSLKQLREELNGKERQLMTQQQLSQKLQHELEVQKALASSLSKQLQEALSSKERHLVAQQQLNKKLQDEKKHVKKLQEQIEKIKDIEKSLLERENTGNKGT
jgi:hypothetical protein